MSLKEVLDDENYELIDVCELMKLMIHRETKGDRNILLQEVEERKRRIFESLE